MDSKLINCDFGDGIIVPMEASKLDKNHYVTENDHERTEVWEYRFLDRIVHRSVHVRLKKGIGIEAMLGRMG